MKLAGVLIDTKNNTAKMETLEYEDSKELDALYEALGCDCIDILSAKVAGKWHDIVCDDEGRLKPNIVSAEYDGVPMLYGNLFICSSDGESLASLTESECKNILHRMAALMEVTDSGTVTARLVIHIEEL